MKRTAMTYKNFLASVGKVRLACLMAVMAVAMMFSSCEHKDLCYHHPHTIEIYVEFDWRNAPDANPLGMCVFFYPVDGGTPVRADFNSRTSSKGVIGGKVDLEEGTYRIIAYNNDTDGILFNNRDQFSTHIGYTREGDILENIYGTGYRSSSTPRARGAEDERVVITPDMMWAATALNVSVKGSGVSYVCIPEEDKGDYQFIENQEQIITLYPRQIVCHYSYEIKNVTNLKHVAMMCGSLSSMSGSHTFSSGELGSECITLPVPASFDRDKGIITGEFYTFGHHEDNTEHHRMLLYVIMDDNSKYYFGSEDAKFDVTEQIHAAPNRLRVHYIIDGLDLPQAIENGHGFSPSVDDWETIYEDIIM